MRWRLSLYCLVFLISATLPGWARPLGQSAAGLAGITGVVRDPSGASIPNAKVVISKENQGTSRSLETNAVGVFAAPALTPGSGYNVIVTSPGFSDYTTQVSLQVGQNINLEVTLKVGGATTQVDVSATAELVDDTKMDLSQVIDSRQIQELPINGRRVDNFVPLTPGYQRRNFGLLTFRGIANGNSFLLDGNDSTERFFMENNGRTRVVSQISQDAVQEFQVVSSDFSAEYGRAGSGGVVNTVTRSGSNDCMALATGFTATRTSMDVIRMPRFNLLWTLAIRRRQPWRQHHQRQVVLLRERRIRPSRFSNCR